MLKIAIDATPIRQKPSGIGMYVFNLISAFYDLREEEEFHLSIAYQPSLKKWLRGDFSIPPLLKQNLEINTLPLPVTISSLLAKFPNLILPYFERSLGYPDVLHGTDHFVYPCTKSVKVMTIHDLTFIKYPNYVNSIVKTYTNRVKQCLKWSDLIITFSENSKADINYLLGVDQSRIFVTQQASRYPGQYLSLELAEQLQTSIAYDFSNPYLLFVSTIEPRKNINSLISAFNYLKSKHKIDHHLIMIGQKGWNYESIFKNIENSPWQEQIHHLGYLSDQQVALFYSQADVFVYPSYYEGFGLPILEAMTLGSPVVTSNSSSLPEVAGDAALLINPDDFMELAEAILRVISDTKLRQKLIQKGKERAKLFSWKKTARQTLKAYQYFY